MGQLFFQEQFNNHGINPSWYFPDARVNYNSPTHRYVYTIQSGFPYCSYIRIDQDSSHHNSRLVKYQQCITLQCQHAVVVDTINNDYMYSRSKKNIPATMIFGIKPIDIGVCTLSLNQTSCYLI